MRYASFFQNWVRSKLWGAAGTRSPVERAWEIVEDIGPKAWANGRGLGEFWCRAAGAEDVFFANGRAAARRPALGGPGLAGAFGVMCCGARSV